MEWTSVGTGRKVTRSQWRMAVSCPEGSAPTIPQACHSLLEAMVQAPCDHHGKHPVKGVIRVGVSRVGSASGPNTQNWMSERFTKYIE